MPIATIDIKAFVNSSLRNQQKVDTLKCLIFKQEHNIIVIKSKRKYWLLIFKEINVSQEIFIVNLKSKRKLKKTLKFIMTNLNV